MNYGLFVLLVIAVGLFGIWNTLRWVRAQPGLDVTLGPLTMSKDAWMRFIFIWNAVGLIVFLIFISLLATRR